MARGQWYIGERSIRLRALVGEDGLPAARGIDKLPLEAMRMAGEPLTREQEHLKEDGEKK